MEMIVIFLIIYLYFIFTDIIPLINNKQYMASRIYIASIITSFAVIIALTFNINIPSPSTFIENIINIFLGT